MPREVDLPACKLCGQGMTFFMQVQFPPGAPWEGRTLCVFSCTSCIDIKHLGPGLPEGINLVEYVVPDDFPDRQQINFRVLVFEPGAVLVVREDYPEKIAFQRIIMTKLKRTNTLRNKVGGEPNWWYFEPENPVSSTGSPLVFLMQHIDDNKLPTLPTAPPQHSPIGIYDQGYYELFSGLPTFFMGIETKNGPRVYVVTT